MASKTEAKFKVGDRVRRVKNEASWAPIGFEAIYLGGGDYIDLYGCRTMMIQDDFELVAPATSAIRTVTRREIVSGKYGIVECDKYGRVEVVAEQHSATDLRAAANLFNELADVLDENAKEAA